MYIYIYIHISFIMFLSCPHSPSVSRSQHAFLAGADNADRILTNDPFPPLAGRDTARGRPGHVKRC